MISKGGALRRIWFIKDGATRHLFLIKATQRAAFASKGIYI